uniref:Uncharacterized protein n=1 Tax=Spongospora subterranea TaxID=70186 RepID=A0A0H5RRP5_9EUKA|eukprot:CRZ11389.1 hypothetical protein [Spongospora subterranea]
MIMRRTLSIAAAAAPTSSSKWPRLQFWHVLLGLSAPIGYYIVRDRRKTAALNDASTELVSARRQELEDLASRSKLSIDSARAIQDRLQQFPNGIRPDDLGDLFVASCPNTEAQSWDMLCMFRNSPTTAEKLEIAEAAVGVSMLINESEPIQTVDLAWRAVQPGMGSISFDQFVDLLDRMLRTGHFTPISLLRQTRLLPPEWSILSGQGIAELYYKKLDKPQSSTITIDEFRTKASGLSHDGDLTLWYLLPKKKSKKVSDDGADNPKPAKEEGQDSHFAGDDALKSSQVAIEGSESRST